MQKTPIVTLYRKGQSEFEISIQMNPLLLLCTLISVLISLNYKFRIFHKVILKFLNPQCSGIGCSSCFLVAVVLFCLIQFHAEIICIHFNLASLKNV